MALSKSDRQITLFFDPKSYKGKQTLAYAKAESLHILEIDVCKTPLTGKQLLELTDLINIPIDQLINQQHQSYEQLIGKRKIFDSEDWIKILKEHPELMKCPIALRGKKAILIETPTDMLKL